MEFFSTTVSKDHPFSEQIPEGFLLNITNVCLASKPEGNERTSLVMTVDDTENDAQGDVQKCTICTLSSAIPNFATSIVVTGMSKVTIEAVGNAEISICGTTEEDPAFDDELDEDEEMGDEDEDEDEEGAKVEEVDDDDE